MKFNILPVYLLVFFSVQNILLAEEDPAEVAIGERLFLETRFAHAY